MYCSDRETARQIERQRERQTWSYRLRGEETDSERRRHGEADRRSRLPVRARTSEFGPLTTCLANGYTVILVMFQTVRGADVGELTVPDDVSGATGRERKRERRDGGQKDKLTTWPKTRTRATATAIKSERERERGRESERDSQDGGRAGAPREAAPWVSPSHSISVSVSCT